MTLNAGEVFVAAAIAHVERDTPDEVGGESAEHHHNEFRKTRPQLGRPGGDWTLCDRISRRKAEAEARAHDTGERRDEDTLLEIELGDGLLFRLRGHFPLLGGACQSGDVDAQQTDRHT